MSMAHLIYQDSEILSEARAKYLKLNGLPPDGGVNDRWARYKMGSKVLIAFPNFRHRVDAIGRHDIHHILKDLDASNLGEGLIGAWELGSGCGRYWISWFMESQALIYGLVAAPRRTWAHFLNGRHSRNFFHEPLSEAVFNQSVGSLRAQMLPSPTQRLTARARDFIALLACALLGLVSMAIFVPIATFFSVVGPVFDDHSRN